MAGLVQTANQEAFAKTKRIVSRVVMLAFPDFSKPFDVFWHSPQDFYLCWVRRVLPRGFTDVRFNTVKNRLSDFIESDESNSGKVFSSARSIFDTRTINFYSMGMANRQRSTSGFLSLAIEFLIERNSILIKYGSGWW
jgi:hypothetical protein